MTVVGTDAFKAGTATPATKNENVQLCTNIFLFNYSEKSKINYVSRLENDEKLEQAKKITSIKKEN